MKRLDQLMQSYHWVWLLALIVCFTFPGEAADQAITRDDPIVEAAPDTTPPSEAAKPLNLFFLGNSYTVSAGGLPDLVKAMLASQGIAPDVQTYIRAGETLEGFWMRNAGSEPSYYERKALERLNEDQRKEKLEQIKKDREKTIGELDKALAAKPWDVVVIQSWTGAKMPEEIGFEEHLKKIVEKVRETSPQARIILYMTWGSQNSATEQGIISKTCHDAARNLQLVVAPAGDAARKTMQAHPDIALYRDEKDSHPGRGGAYLAACTIVAAITDKSPEGLPASMMIPVSYDFPFTVRSEGYTENFKQIDKKKPAVWDIEPKTAKSLQKIAWETYQASRQRLAAESAE